MALGVRFENCGSLHAPVPGLLVPLEIFIELGQEGLDVNFFLEGQNYSLEGIT